MVDVSILIVNYNSWGVLADALDSLHAQRLDDYEIVVVDNASPQRSEPEIAAVRTKLRDGLDRLILHDSNDGYAAGMNLAFTHCSGRYVLVSNPDVVYLPDCLTHLASFLETWPDVAIATPITFVDPGQELRLPTGVLPRLGDRPWFVLTAMSQRARDAYGRRRTARYLPVFRPDGDVDIELAAGWGFLMRRSVVDELGFFDPVFPLYYEDADLSKRVRAAGYRIVQVERARMIHHYDQSAQTDREIAASRHDRSELRFFRKHHGIAGRWLTALSRRVLRSGPVQRRATARPPAAGRTLQWNGDRAELLLPAPCADFLVEAAFDPWFLLCAATFGSGDRWIPGSELQNWLEQRPTYFRVVDLTRPELREIGRWRSR